MNLTLDPEVVLRDLRMWRDATLMTRRRSAPRRDSEPRMLAASMTSAAQRADGFLMLLQSCSIDPSDAGELARLVTELREFKAWAEQGQYAAQLLQTFSPTPSRKRAPAHTHR